MADTLDTDHGEEVGDGRGADHVPNRIKVIIGQLDCVWRRHPQWTLSQVLCNAAASGDPNAVGPNAMANLGAVLHGMHRVDPFSVTDDVISSGLEVLGAPLGLMRAAALEHW